MGLNKAIEHGKEKRKPYQGAKAVDCTCRNHGTCDYCKANRLHKFRDKDKLIINRRVKRNAEDEE